MYTLGYIHTANSKKCHMIFILIYDTLVKCNCASRKQWNTHSKANLVAYV